MPQYDSSQLVLLVEGPNDKHVVNHLREHSKSIPEITIISRGGV